MPRAEQALRHHLLLVDVGAAAGETPPRVGAVRVLPLRRRHRRRPRRRRRPTCAPRPSPTSATASSPTSPRVAPTTRCSRPSSTRCAPSTSTPSCFRRFLRSMTMDLTIAAYETWDDLLVYMDGSAAVIGEMMLPILEPRSPDARRPRARSRARVPADQLPARRRRGPRSRSGLPAPGGPRPLRRRPARRTVDDAVAGADALRDRPVPRAVRLRRRGHRDAPAGVGPLRRAGPCPLLRHPRRIERRTTTCSRRGRGSRPGEGGARRRAWRRDATPLTVIVALVGAGLLWGAGVARLRPGRLRRPATGRAPARGVGDRAGPQRGGDAPPPAPIAARLEPPPHEVIVVDDCSDDDTAGVASAARRDRARRRPSCRRAGSASRGRATSGQARRRHPSAVPRRRHRLRPGRPRRASSRATRHGGLVSVQPYHVTERPYEQLSALLQRRGDDGDRCVRPVAPSAAAVRSGRACSRPPPTTDAVGGHAAVRDEMVEDVASPERYRAAGLPVTCFAGGDAVRFRMYPGRRRQLVDGWSKNIAAGAARRIASPPRDRGVGRRPRRRRDPGRVRPWAGCGAATRLRARRGVGRRRPAAMDAAPDRLLPMVDRVAFPIPLAAFIGIFAGRSRPDVRRARSSGAVGGSRFRVGARGADVPFVQLSNPATLAARRRRVGGHPRRNRYVVHRFPPTAS